MTDSTNDHKEQARKLIDYWRETTDWPGLVWSPQNLNDEPRWRAAWDDLENEITSALSSRDAEIKEVLEGLSDDGCYDACFLRWMKRYEDSGGFEHSEACLAARALYAKLNGGSHEAT